MDLKNWVSLSREHWKEFLPEKYKAEVEAKTLGQSLHQAAEQTFLEVSSLEEQGFNPQEAWEMTREKYLLLPPEPQPDERREPNAYQVAMQSQQALLDDLTAQETIY